MPPLPVQLRAHVVGDHRHLLGEGPVWDAAAGRLRWVDIEAGEVFEGTVTEEVVTVTDVRRVGGTVGAVAPGPDGTLLVAGATGLVLLSPDGTTRPGPQVLSGTTQRLNDGACDPGGRFLVGSLSLTEPTGAEVLVRLEHDGRLTTLDDDLGLSNGLGWSPDGSTFYSTDTLASTVYRRQYDPATGAVGPREVHLEVDGSPDGLAVDEAGGLWVAVWGGGQVRRYAADGTVTAIVPLPLPNPTSVAFAGPDLDLLVITTASVDSPAEASDAGRLFAVDPGVRGLPRTPWAGGLAGA